MKVNEKQIAVDWDGQPKHFNISQVLPDPGSIGEQELERLTKAFDQFRSPPPPMVSITEILAHNDPRSRTPEMENVKRKELAGIAKRALLRSFVEKTSAKMKRIQTLWAIDFYWPSKMSGLARRHARPAFSWKGILMQKNFYWYTIAPFCRKDPSGH